jgi:nicotinate phosphoribosyltransferase
MAAEELGGKLYGVRLDTPSSRRGKMRDIVEEVRWALDINGFKGVKIFVSGGIDEDSIRELRDLVDGFGVGTSIAAAPSVDLSMDIVEVDRGEGWEPVAKRGKFPGARMMYDCWGKRLVVRWGLEPPTCQDGSKPSPLMEKYIEEGSLIKDLPSLDEIRRYVLDQIKNLDV